MDRRRAIFLDRDGVINENPANYVKSWDELHFLPGALAALKDLAGLPWPIVMITNQSAVGRGIISHQVLDDIHGKLLDQVREAGGRFDGIYVCPHTPEDRCSCRKPQPGLFLQAAEELSLELEGSIMVGDSLIDAQAALAVQILPILVISMESELRTITFENQAVLDRCILVPSLEDAVKRLIFRYQASLGELQTSPMVYFANQKAPTSKHDAAWKKSVN